MAGQGVTKYVGVAGADNAQAIGPWPHGNHIGDNVQAVVPWKPPAAFEGLDLPVMDRIFQKLREAPAPG